MLTFFHKADFIVPHLFFLSFRQASLEGQDDISERFMKARADQARQVSQQLLELAFNVFTLQIGFQTFHALPRTLFLQELALICGAHC